MAWRFEERVSEDCDVFEQSAFQEADGIHDSGPADSGPNVNDEVEVIASSADCVKIVSSSECCGR
jgi:hypothetical protein